MDFLEVFLKRQTMWFVEHLQHPNASDAKGRHVWDTVVSDGKLSKTLFIQGFLSPLLFPFTRNDVILPFLVCSVLCFS